MKKSGCVVTIGVLIAVFVIFLMVSLGMGGNLPGLTYIQPGNVGLQIDNYKGVVDDDLMPPGVHWQGMWTKVVEVPTMQRTLQFEPGDGHDKPDTQISVNTSSNMLTCDVTVQYGVQGAKAKALYNDYQDTFADLDDFEAVNVRPSITEAVNYAVGDLDTAEAMTTAGKSKAETQALKMLQDEWGPRGLDFRTLLIRAVQPDQQTTDLLHQTTSKLQEIENANLALQQQTIDNATAIQTATADAQIDRDKASTLTDLYLKDKILQRVHTVYLPSDQIMGFLNK